VSDITLRKQRAACYERWRRRRATPGVNAVNAARCEREDFATLRGRSLPQRLADNFTIYSP